MTKPHLTSEEMEVSPIQKTNEWGSNM